jgi:aminoglycoside phosphotransferase (APT) family kinase protein
MDSRTGPDAPLTYLVYRMIPGVSMQSRLGRLSERDLLQIFRTLLQQIDALARIPVAGFGDLRGAGHGAFASLQAFVAAALKDGLSAIGAKRELSPTMIRQIQSIGAAVQELGFQERPSLCWGDISPDNIILDDRDQLVGLVDFEGALAAEHELHLGFLRSRYFGTAVYEAFVSSWQRGYGPATPRAALYVVLRALRLLPYAHLPLPTGVPRKALLSFLPGLRSAIEEASAWARGAHRSAARTVP